MAVQWRLDREVLSPLVLTIEVQNRQQFLGKLCPNMARTKIEGVWYEISRNNVSEKLEGGCELN